ncbi:hypothetical protein SEA_DIRTYBOI_54 [Gordonia phage DirtyBoi]|nr:hypothetical protein SEA_DIRTYBOI_54 [Gordonia phage DirtyBoi]
MDPDDWWHSLPADRRHQIYRWIEQPRDGHAPTPGQRDLFPHLSADEPVGAGGSDGPRHRSNGGGGRPRRNTRPAE